MYTPLPFPYSGIMKRGTITFGNCLETCHAHIALRSDLVRSNVFASVAGRFIDRELRYEKIPFSNYNASCADNESQTRYPNAADSLEVAKEKTPSADVRFFLSLYFFFFFSLFFFFLSFLPFVTIAEPLASFVRVLTRRSVNRKRNNDYGKGETDA